MTEEFDTWKTGITTRIKERTKMYTDQDKEKLSIDYPERLLAKVPRFLATEDEIAQFKLDVEQITAAIPELNIKDSFEYKEYMKLVNASRADLRKRYNLVHKGFYVSLWLSLGVALGLPFGIPLKNIALGIPISIAIGLAIGAGLEKKAEKEGRIL